MIDTPATRKSLLSSSCVIILPDGDDGWYINSPVRTKDRYQDYLGEVIRTADEHFHLSRFRRKRGIAGWSMGGYGAVRIAQTWPKEFGCVASVIGLLDFPREGLPAGQDYVVPTDRFGQDRQVWRSFNPIHSAGKLHDSGLLIVFADRAFDRTMNQNFAQQLERLNIPFEKKQLQGGHTFDVVTRALPHVIHFMDSQLTLK